MATNSAKLRAVPVQRQVDWPAASPSLAALIFTWPQQLVAVGHAATHHRLAVLDQHRLSAVLEDDIVLRVALAQLLVDFDVEIVVLVLGLPIAERHPQIMEDRTVRPDAVLLRRGELILRNEDEVFLPRPGLQQVLERGLSGSLCVRP